MGTVLRDLDSLTINESIFKDLKYYLSGDVPEKIIVLLSSGGAENTKYFSDYVTHLICGNNASDRDVEEAHDIYQIPAVSIEWVVACVRLKRLANPNPYTPNKNKIFSNVIACLAKVSANDAKALYALITYHGGHAQLNFDANCTHLICGSASGKKYSAALSLPVSRIKIVTPDWVHESLRARIQAVTEVFHPKLLIVPQSKVIDTRISAITGFDFEESIAKNEVPTQNIPESKDDGKQAFLDKLKQRMPWNHIPTNIPTMSVTTTAATSMAFTSTAASPVTNIINKAVPQGMIAQNIQTSAASPQLIPKFTQNTIVTSQPGINVSSQGNMMPQQQQQFIQSQPPHGMNAIQMQQQKVLQQHQLRMQMLQQQQKHPNQQPQQTFQQSPNTSVSQMTPSHPTQMQQHIQSSQLHLQQSQNLNQVSNSTLTQAQQIENISQMLSQSANNLQQSQLNQQGMTLKQGLTPSQQTAVQNIAQQLAQSTQNLQNKLNQGQLLREQNQSIGSQNQNLIQQQSVQSLVSQHQNINMNVANQQGLVTSSQAQQGQQLGQLVTSGGQQNVIGQQIQTIQQNIQNQQASNVQVQNTWRQQNIQMVQNVGQGQHIIRSPLVQQRNQSQVILQQQILQQTQQQQLINNQQQQASPQHTIQQTNQQILQQSISSQNQSLGQTHHQILVQKQQILNSSGQQQIVQGPQQVLINQHTGQQQILVHSNQQVTLQGSQQIVSQSQIIHQGGQIGSQQNQQVLSQGGQHVITQQGSQHQVVIAQPSVGQTNQQIIGQGQQQVLTQVPQSPGAPSGGIQQIITHGGGQQIVQGQNVTWQQQQYLQQRQQIGQPGSVGPRVVSQVAWTAGGGARQLIHLDAQTHAQLQQLDPQQRVMFVAQLQKRRQLSMQRAAAIAQQQAQVNRVPKRKYAFRY